MAKESAGASVQFGIGIARGEPPKVEVPAIEKCAFCGGAVWTPTDGEPRCNVCGRKQPRA